MNYAETATSSLEVSGLPSGAPRGVFRRLLRRPLALLAIMVIVAIYAVGLVAPFVAPYGFNDTDFDHRFAGSSSEHILGTDRLGRDVLSRLMWSAETTVIVSAATIVTGGLVLGVGLGLFAGYLGGRADSVIMRTGDAFASLPTILLLLIINSTLRQRVLDAFSSIQDVTGIGGIVNSGLPDYFLVFGALSLFSWVGIARIVRSQALALREADYIEAASSMGASTFRIVFRHLVPNVSNLLIIAITLNMGGVAALEVGLSFLGIGIHGPHASFGIMVSDYADSVRTHFSLIAYPMVAIVALVFSFNLLGDQLTDILSPRRR